MKHESKKKEKKKSSDSAWLDEMYGCTPPSASKPLRISTPPPTSKPLRISTPPPASKQRRISTPPSASKTSTLAQTRRKPALISPSPWDDDDDFQEESFPSPGKQNTPATGKKKNKDSRKSMEECFEEEENVSGFDLDFDGLDETGDAKHYKEEVNYSFYIITTN